MRRFWATAAVAALGVAGTVAAAAPASAAGGSCGITVPTKVAVQSPYQKIPVTYGNDCVTNHAWAAWLFVHPTQGPMSGVDYDTERGDDRFDAIEYYDFMPVGTFTLDPQGAEDTANGYSSLYQNAPTTTVKLGTRVALASSRSGSYVTLRTTTAVYSSGASNFVRYKSANVLVQYRTCSTCSWVNLTQGRTDSSAAFGYTTYAPTARYYRAALFSGPTTWDKISPSTYR